MVKPRLSAERLIERGYLPRELPPTFTSSDLAKLSAKLSPSSAVTEFTRHNLARAGGTRRPLGLPNPRSYVRLAKRLQTDWKIIAAHLDGSRWSISSPAVGISSERALRPRYKASERPKIRARDRRGRRWIMTADISQFYASIYTHSVPWALDGKAAAKAKKDAARGGKLDAALRACANGQTIGLPIGPDSSFLIAEVILSAVDKRLQTEFPSMRGFRYFDDYEAAFATQSEAAESLASLEALLAEFELSLNPTKTAIRELPAPLDITWSRELTRHELRTATSAKTKKDLIDLFSRAAELAPENAGSLKYALRRTQFTDLRAGDWPTYQNLVWSVVSSEPTTMSLGLDLLVSKALKLKTPVDQTAASSVVESMIATHAPLRNGSEVVWALWTSVYLKLDLSATAAALCAQMDDNFVALVALHADHDGRFSPGALDTTRWESAVSRPDALVGPDWLLAYEAGRRKWLRGSTAQITSDSFFSHLTKANVAFYDTDPSWTPFSGPSAPLPGGPFPDEYL